MKAYKIALSILGVAISLVAMTTRVERSWGSPSASSPEGVSTSGKPPFALPTRPPTARPFDQCDAYLFSHVQLHKNRNGAQLLSAYVDQASFNGVKLPFFVPTQEWDVNSPNERDRTLALIANSGTKPAYQPENAIPANLKTNLDNWFHDRMKSFYESRYDPNNLSNLASATDVRLNWYFWSWMYAQNPGSFASGSLGRYFHVTEGEQLHPRNREVITVNGVNEIVLNFIDHFYFDKNGKLLSDKPTGVAKICDAGVWYNLGCPLSLILKPGFDINSDIHTTDFPIDPARAGQRFIWKASREAPLLVYDPAHTRKITSASQLFGHFTFGGTKGASLSGNAVDGVSPGLWRDGFQALASLDADGSGAIEGRELDDLALWSDFNHDGKSDLGEVKSVREHKISRLFYKLEGTQKPGHDVYLNVGFEREANGRTEIGRSVDWYSTSAATDQGLISNVFSFAKTESDCNHEETKMNAGQDVQLPLAKETGKRGASVIGGWKWQLDGDPAVGPFGYLVFEADKDKVIQGTNFAVLPSPQNLPGDIGATIQMTNVTFEKLEGNEASFVVYVSEGGKIKTNVTVSDDGETMRGTSIATTKVKGELVSIKYSWKADRIGG